MRRWTTTAVTLAAIGCGGSEQEASPPAQTPAAGAQAPAPAPRRPSFPAADQFRIGESATLQGSGSVECDKLYLGDDVVALVEMWMHTGDGAVVRRCVGSDWADPASPTAAELAAVGAQLDGRLAEDFDGVGVDMDGALTFSPLGLADRASEITFAGRWAAYATASNVRDAAGGGQEADVIGVVYDLPARVPLQQFLLGTCSLSGSDGLTLEEPTWAQDGRAVTFHGIAGRCSFEEVEAHPE
jgi:hypothetical protein